MARATSCVNAYLVHVTSIAGQLLPAHPEWSRARRRLYETALTMFGDHGYHAVSVRDIAGALGQQPGALYAHVASKEHLLAELVLVGLTDHRDAIVRAVQDAGEDPVAQLDALVRAHVRMHADFPELARVVAREYRSLSAGGRAALHEVRRQSADVLVDVIRRGADHGCFTVAEPVLAMRAIAGMGVLVAEWVRDEPVFRPELIADHFADLALRMLSADQPTATAPDGAHRGAARG